MSRVTKAFNGSKDIPVEMVEYRLCKEFGWTPAELDEQSQAKINKFITIMSIENQLIKAEQQSAEKHGKR